MCTYASVEKYSHDFTNVFNLQVAQKTLPFYKEYFNISYPLPKMDLIAIPDFAAGESDKEGSTKEGIQIWS